MDEKSIQEMKSTQVEKKGSFESNKRGRRRLHKAKGNEVRMT
jgi:hypothetical protein